MGEPRFFLIYIFWRLSVKANRTTQLLGVQPTKGQATQIDTPLPRLACSNAAGGGPDFEAGTGCAGLRSGQEAGGEGGGRERERERERAKKLRDIYIYIHMDL